MLTELTFSECLDLEARVIGQGYKDIFITAFIHQIDLKPHILTFDNKLEMLEYISSFIDYEHDEIKFSDSTDCHMNIIGNEGDMTVFYFREKDFTSVKDYITNNQF